MLAVVLIALAVAPDEAPELTRAKELYQSMHYEQAQKALAKAITSPGLTPEDRAQIYLYTGLCRHQSGDEKGALKAFKEALTIDAKLELPQVSPKARRAFERVKAEIAAEQPPPEPAKPVVVEEPSKPAPVEPAPVVAPAVTAPVVVAQPEKTHRWWPSLLAGGAAIASAGVGVYFGSQAVQTRKSADMAMFAGDGFRLTQQAQSQALTANVLYVVAGVLAAFGIVGAFVF
ncbi:MAG: tetratricopeptide repeat protein [Myxococcaceae bacterium]